MKQCTGCMIINLITEDYLVREQKKLYVGNSFKLPQRGVFGEKVKWKQNKYHNDHDLDLNELHTPLELLIRY